MDDKTKKRRDWNDEELLSLSIKDYTVLVESVNTDDFIDRNAETWRRLYSAMNKIEERKIKQWRSQKENELREWKARQNDFSVLLENLEARASSQELYNAIQELKEKYNNMVEEESRFEDEKASEEKEMIRLVNKLKVYLE